MAKVSKAARTGVSAGSAPGVRGDAVNPLVLPLLVALGVVLPVQANENSLSYEIEAGYEFNDNVRLLPDEQAIDISGGKVALPLSFVSKTERFTGEVEARAEFSRFDETEYDSDDQRVEGRATYLLERGEVSAYALINRDTTRDSEFLDTGIVGLAATRREAAEAGGAIDYSLTERSGYLARFDVADVSYDADRFEDYQYATGDLGVFFRASDRLRWQLRAHGVRFETDGRVVTTSEGLGGKVGFDADLSERSQLEILAGWLEVDSDYGAGADLALPDDSTGSHLVDARYRFDGERYDLTATWVSAPLPSGAGFLQRTDQLTLRYRYSLSERSRVILDVIGGRRGAVDDRINIDRDYARVGVRLERRLTASWFIAGRYMYTRQDREQVPGTADANEVHLSLVYRPRASVW